MVNKIKSYLEYIHNRRVAKKEMAKLLSTTLPVINELNEKTVNIAKFILKLTDASKNIEGEKLIQMVLEEISNILQTDNNRLIEVLSYIAQQTPQDIQKVIFNAIIKTNTNSKEN